MGGFRASKIALGTGAFGTGVPAREAFEEMDLFARHGGNLLDTARVYGSWAEDGDGASERTVGDFLRVNGRENFILSTKGGHPPLGRMTESRLDQGSLSEDLDRSLEALGTDRAEIWFLHRDDERIPVSEIMPVLDGFVRSGRVVLLGASNWRGGRIAEANAFAEANGLAPFSVSQICFSLAQTTPERLGDPTLVAMNGEEAKFYETSGMPVMAFSSQAQGYFSKTAAGIPLKNRLCGPMRTEQTRRGPKRSETLPLGSASRRRPLRSPF